MSASVSSVLRWTVPAAVLTAATIALLWLNRPFWAICVDGPDPTTSGCESGTLSLAAIVGTVALVVLLAGFVVLTLRVAGRHRRTVLAAGFGVLIVAMLWSFAMQNVWPIEQAPY